MSVNTSEPYFQMISRAIQKTALLFAILAATASSCHKDDVSPVIGLKPLDNLTEGSVIKYTFLDGRGPHQGDLVCLVNEDTGISFSCPIDDLSMTAFTFRAPEGLTDGNYLFSIKRGREVFEIGKVKYSLVKEYVPDFLLENEVLRKYLDEVNYPDGDYGFTKVTDYYKIATTYRKDQPAPVVLSWEKAPEGTINQHITIARNQFLSNTDATVTIGPESSECQVYNLIPGEHYFYKVAAINAEGNSSTIAKGEFTTSGRRRMLKVDGIHNVRDFGGQITADGIHRIKYGKIFRGSEMQGPNGITIAAEGIPQARALGIDVDIDLRTAERSLNITQSPLGNDIHFWQYPEATLHGYAKILLGNTYIRVLRQIIKEMMKDEDCGVYIHCKVGADRTGTISFLIEGLLGISENDMCKDWEITSFANPPGLRQRNETNHNYQGMVSTLKTVPGATLQDKFYNYFTTGVVDGGDRIGTSPVDSIAWFREHMLEGIAH